MGLQDQLQATSAPAWMPTDKGDMLCGKVVGRSTRTTEHGDYDIITIDPKGAADGCAIVGGLTDFAVKVRSDDGATDAPYTGGPLAWHAMGSVGRNEVERNDPQVGDAAGILFDGTGIAQQGPGRGRSYKIWRVVVEQGIAHAAANVPEQPSVAPASSAGAPQVAADVPYEDEEPF